MQLNIKNDEAYRLAAQLAAMTGETLTQAVTKALAERIERERRKHHVERELSPEEIERRLRRIRELQAAAKVLLKPGVTFSEDDLYDENGLPK